MTDRSIKSHSHRKVLFADDEKSIRDSIAQTIKKVFACEVAVAASGEEALQKLDSEPWDVLVTDMLMPGIHGPELIARVRIDWPDTGIIVMTGYPDDFPFVEVVEAGADDFIAKPYRTEEMNAKLLRLFRERDLAEKLYAAEDRYRCLFQRSMGGNLVLQQESYKIVDVNDAFCYLSGLSKEQILNMNLFDLVTEAERDRFVKALEIFKGTRQGTLGDAVLVHVDGQELSVDISMTFIDVSTEPVIYLTFNDVTEKRRLENQLADIAHTDEVTGLANRRALFSKLELVLARARRGETPVSLMFIDLDDFKQCNDNYGHQKGDELLKTAGEIIRKCIRTTGGDDAFRYGGDEFAVLLVGTDVDGVRIVAERIRSAFEEAQSYGTTMSIGIAAFAKSMRPKGLIREADDALYKAKAAGKNAIYVA